MSVNYSVARRLCGMTVANQSRRPTSLSGPLSRSLVPGTPPRDQAQQRAVPATDGPRIAQDTRQSGGGQEERADMTTAFGLSIHEADSANRASTCKELNVKGLGMTCLARPGVGYSYPVPTIRDVCDVWRRAAGRRKGPEHGMVLFVVASWPSHSRGIATLVRDVWCCGYRRQSCRALEETGAIHVQRRV